MQRKQRYVYAFLIHREVLAPKSLPGGLQDVLKVIIKIVNFVTSSTLHTLLFQKLRGDVESERKKPFVLLYTKLRWLSMENVLFRVFELRDELKIFKNNVKLELAILFIDSNFIAYLAYLVNILDSLSILNLKLLGKKQCYSHCRLGQCVC